LIFSVLGQDRSSHKLSRPLHKLGAHGQRLAI